MPILGVVLTHPDPSTILADLSVVPGVLTVGVPTLNRLPAVLETRHKNDDEALFDVLRALPGVLGVDLAYADFSDLTHEVSS